MDQKNKNLSKHILDGAQDYAHLSIGVVVSEWNAHITNALLEGCLDTLTQNGLDEGKIHVIRVPGTFELPTAAKFFAVKDSIDAVVCLGCVIKGDTNHDEYINQAVATGLVTLSLATSKPVIFGVVTTLNEQQALDRAGGSHGNKGIEAAQTALKMAKLAQELKKSKKTIGY
ncbi:MAG: 6,7-dimethyl-8-ribityllumazine synthase [Saprospiraceae bacterium]|nr:6,7-dimethyl-8-ribityllumazine synthase [Saprospiraceae bacterium]